MRRIPRVESIRTGRSPDAGFPSGSRAVVAFCADLAPMSQLDRTRIEALATDLAAEAIASAVPNQHGAGIGRRRRLLPRRWRRRAAITTLMSSLVAKVAFASVALAATTGGLAASGNLPEPAQQVVSDVASRIGISIPSPSIAEESAVPDDVGPGSTVPADGPSLPEPAPDPARRVIETVFDGDAVEDRAEFGKRVSETASGGRSHGRPGDVPGPKGPQGDDFTPPGHSNGDSTPGPPDGVGGGPPTDPGPPTP